MKKLLLLSFIVFISISSCKKDKKPSKPLDQTIISTSWLTTVDKIEYFNEAGAKLHEVSNKIGFKYAFNSETKKVTITDLEGNKTRKDFILERVNGKDYVIIGTGETSEKFEITGYTSKTMNWKQQKTNLTYDGGKVAAKAVVTVDLHCPCRD